MLALGLLLAAVETAAHGMAGAKQGFFMSAYDMWYTLRPKNLLIFEMRTERLAPWLWDPVLRTILILPAWFIFGIPGGIMIWISQHGRRGESDQDIDEVMDSFRLFNELTRLAKLENPKGENHGPRDMLPDHLIGQDIAPDANAPGEFMTEEDFREGGGEPDKG